MRGGAASRQLSAAKSSPDWLGLRYGVQADQAALAQAIAAARMTLGEPAVSAAWDAGRSLSPGRALLAAQEPFAFPLASRMGSLTPREVDVLRLLAAGKSNQEIALKLHISESTVEKHLGSVYAKLGVGSRVEAAVYAIRNNLD